MEEETVDPGYSEKGYLGSSTQDSQTGQPLPSPKKGSPVPHIQWGPWQYWPSGRMGTYIPRKHTTSQSLLNEYLPPLLQSTTGRHDRLVFLGMGIHQKFIKYLWKTNSMKERNQTQQTQNMLSKRNKGISLKLIE